MAVRELSYKNVCSIIEGSFKGLERISSSLRTLNFLFIYDPNCCDPNLFLLFFDSTHLEYTILSAGM